MGRRPRSTLPARVKRVGDRIERWRRQRPKRSAMPAELWDAAVSLARAHGVYPIARALRIDYGALKKRIGRLPKTGGKGGRGLGELIEFTPVPLLGSGEPVAVVVELCGRDGTKLVVRLAEFEALDLSSLAEAYWKRGA